MITITLPIPDRRLSPNARVHWAARSKATKAARTMAFVHTCSTWGALTPRPKWPKARMRVTLYHKTKRTPDPANFMATLKAYEDGIADAGIVANDRGLWPERPVYILDCKYPRIEITIEPEP
jgi:crossover junction endodeoxyribonuclease RusA